MNVLCGREGNYAIRPQKFMIHLDQCAPVISATVIACALLLSDRLVKNRREGRAEQSFALTVGISQVFNLYDGKRRHCAERPQEASRW